MKKWKAGLMAMLLLSVCACGKTPTQVETTEHVPDTTIAETEESIQEPIKEVTSSGAASRYEGAYVAKLSVDGNHVFEVPEGQENPFVVDNDIVYYEAGHDFTYGEGSEADEHTKEEAETHTVLHLTKPGTYVLSGTLKQGQIAVDLGEEAEDDPNAVVTLVLDGLDITCTVAPAVIFYEVYECGDDESPEAVVDTSAAGANVIVADGSVNVVNGSYVARIYKSVELNDEGTEVIDSKKLHKYDGAFYSKKSMNVGGETENSGILYINAENEGLDSEMHLTINGGQIYINSGNDGINTNEDEVSVTTVNGGLLNIVVNGSTGEGDGIDSNGWLVINGGTVIAQACSTSGDAGIDSDMGIHVNGGTVIATGNMLDRISKSDATYAVFQFNQRMSGGKNVVLKNAEGETVITCTPENDYMYLIVADPELVGGEYTLWVGGKQMAHGETSFGGMGGGRGQMPGGMQKPEGMEIPEGMTMPEGMEKPEGMKIPEGMTKPEGVEMPEGMTMPEGMAPPEGEKRPGVFGEMNNGMEAGEISEVFSVKEGGNQFTGVTEWQETA